MRVQEKEVTNEELERSADILEEDDGQGEGGRCCCLGARQREGACGGTVGLVNQFVVHSHKTMFDLADL